MKQDRHFRWLLIAFFCLMAVAPFAAYSADGVYTSSEYVGKAQGILVQDGELRAGSFQAGVLDEPTTEALRAFQVHHSLRCTGVLDQETMALLTSHGLGEGAPAADSDEDGVPDTLDACPHTPAGAEVDSRGCTSDSDRDRVPDGIDQCPDTPRGATVDARGCPMDTDNDGVIDGIDYCPDTPADRKVDERGCPLGLKQEVFEGKAKLTLEGVNFESGSAKLTPDSLAILDQVAVSLRDWPNVRVEIGGHTDSNGKESENMSLSQARAESVRDYLVSQGIDDSRLVAKGYGESEPVADNKFPDGRAKNRRVELTKIH